MKYGVSIEPVSYTHLDVYKRQGYEWADEAAPRFQLDPQGWRGYIEARPVREI